MTNRREYYSRIARAVESVLSEEMKAENIQTGDTTPYQEFLIEGYLDKLTEIHLEIINQNR